MTTLLQSVDANGVATLTLNRPDKRNALDYELIGSLKEALEGLDARADVRIITLEGAGDYFCAGGDIGSMIRVTQRSSSANEQDALALARMLHALDTVSKPTIALAKGVVVGGGVGLLACCDIVVAADDASFSLNEVRLGLASGDRRALSHPGHRPAAAAPICFDGGTIFRRRGAEVGSRPPCGAKVGGQFGACGDRRGRVARRAWRAGGCEELLRGMPRPRRGR